MKVKLRCINCGQKYKFSVEPGIIFEFTCIKCQTDQTFQSPDEAAEQDDLVIMVETQAIVESNAPDPDPPPAVEPPSPLKLPKLHDLKPLNLKNPLTTTEPNPPPIKPEMPNVPRAPRQNLTGNVIPVPSPGFEAKAAEVSHQLPNEHQVTITFDDNDCNGIDGNIADKIKMFIKWTFRVAGLLVLVAVAWAVWKFFLDPGGKIAWRHELPIASFNVLDNQDGQLTFMNGDEIMVLDSEKGEISPRGKIPDLEKHPQIIHRMNNGQMLFSGAQNLALIDLSGKKHWEKSFDFSIESVSCGRNIAVAQTVESTKIKEKDGFPIYDYQYRIAALNLENGQELWSQGPRKNEAFFNYPMTGGNILVYREYEKVKDEDKDKINWYNRSYNLVAMEMATGKPVWRLKLEGETAWGPLIKADNLIFKQRNKLIALDLANGDTKWELTVRGNPYHGFNWWSSLGFGNIFDSTSTANPDIVYFITALSMAAIDVNNGKELWNQKFGFAPAISEVSDKYFFLGSVRDKESRPDDNVKLPPAYEQLKNEEPGLGFEGISGGAMKKTVQGVSCYSVDTGKKLWHVEHIFGRVIASGDRIVIFWDSADTATGNMLGSRHGQTVVQQYSAKSGKKLFSQSDKIALSGPYLICGRKLIALTYDRAVGNRAKRDGIIAFNLK